MYWDGDPIYPDEQWDPDATPREYPDGTVELGPRRFDGRSCAGPGVAAGGSTTYPERR